MGEGSSGSFDVSKFNLDLFPEVKARLTAPAIPTAKPRKHQRDWFLKGPIPGPWVTKLLGLSLAAVRVGLAVWHVAICTKSLTVTLAGVTLERFAINRLDRGLADLEQAGLIRVDRQRGRRPEITILEITETC